MSSQIPGAGASLLHFLVHQAFSRDPREGIYGLAPEDVRLLTGLNLRQQRYLEERVPYFVEMKVDTERMRNMIRRAQECEKEYLLQQGLIRHGATQPLMQGWFGMGPAEFRGQCALVHDDPLPKGRRPTVLEAKLEGQVADALHTHQHVPVPE
ncbi:STY4526/YPO1902 family pathogenicity island replication protein, partial [Plasticicumulans acidivorans]